MSALPASHRAVKQALTDLGGCLEQWLPARSNAPGDLWLEDAIVLLDWLASEQARTVTEHEAVLEGPFRRLHDELEESCRDAMPLTTDRLDEAQHEVSKDMGW